MKDSLGLRLAQERRDYFFTELKKGKTKVADVVLIQIFVMLIYICLPMILVIRFINSERLEVFLKDIIPWKTFPVFLRFWSWLIDRISLSERLVFFILKDTSNWFRKTCFFSYSERHFILSERLGCYRKTCIFFRKTWILIFRKTGCWKTFSLLSERLLIFFRKTYVFSRKTVVVFFRKTCEFFRKTVVIFFRKTCLFFRKTCNFLQKDLFIFQKDL